MAKVEGVYEVDYIMTVKIPPNIPRELMEGAVLSSVAWNGNMLPHCHNQEVKVYKINPGSGQRVLDKGLKLQ